VILFPTLQIITLLGTVSSVSPYRSVSPSQGVDALDPRLVGDAMTTLLGVLNSARAFFNLDFSQLLHLWSCQDQAVLPYHVVWAAPLYVIGIGAVLLITGWLAAQHLLYAELTRQRCIVTDVIAVVATLKIVRAPVRVSLGMTVGVQLRRCCFVPMVPVGNCVHSEPPIAALSCFCSSCVVYTSLVVVAQLVGRRSAFGAVAPPEGPDCSRLVK
jgi:hypothetical protein